jgi:hypothetical protein
VFYLSGLGLTRDPYLMVGLENMWVNAGRHQFHLPTGKPQVVRGHVGLVLPDLAALEARLAKVAPALAETRFGYARRDGFIEVTCPWGNRFRCYAPADRFGGHSLALGIGYVEFDVPRDSAAGIARFYSDIMGAQAQAREQAGSMAASIKIGGREQLLFRESADPLPEYDGHHIQFYLADFSGPYAMLKQRGLISEESDQHQYRFRDIVDPNTGQVLYTIEHEIRSLRHPLYARPLVNRNPAQSNRDYAPGRDALCGGY